nr:MAG TPA: YopX protein [Caudoviricetes sp.]
MREILFRGKRVDNGEWVFGDLEHNGKNVPKWVNGNEIVPETVGQFTGLTDKNGKKIFEGDIVKGDLGLGYGDNENHIAYIEYQEDGMSFCLVEILEEDFGKCAEISDDLEVIGNIYDNPELLEK